MRGRTGRAPVPLRAARLAASEINSPNVRAPDSLVPCTLQRRAIAKLAAFPFSRSHN